MGYEQKEANRLVASAWERGVNYYDVAPSYGDGEAEIKLGPALAPYRRKAFLACKTARRDAAGAQKEFEQSLRRLRTDYFDLYQFHAVSSMEDVEKILAPGRGRDFPETEEGRQGAFSRIFRPSRRSGAGIDGQISGRFGAFPGEFRLLARGSFRSASPRKGAREEDRAAGAQRHGATRHGRRVWRRNSASTGNAGTSRWTSRRRRGWR